MCEVVPLDKNLPNNPNCSGVVYKCRVNNYVDSRGAYISKTSFIPMKRLSCPGCVDCQYIKDLLRDEVAADNECVEISSAHDNHLYRVECSYTYHPEYGKEFDHLTFVEIPQKAYKVHNEVTLLHVELLAGHKLETPLFEAYPFWINRAIKEGSIFLSTVDARDYAVLSVDTPDGFVECLPGDTIVYHEDTLDREYYLTVRHSLDNRRPL